MDRTLAYNSMRFDAPINPAFPFDDNRSILHHSGSSAHVHLRLRLLQLGDVERDGHHVGDPAGVEVWSCLATIGDHLPEELRLRKTVGRLATYLRDRGVGRGDRVAIHLQNRIELVVALFAAALLGAIHVVLNARLRPQGLAKILEQADVSVILVDETTLANLAEVPPDLPRLCVGEPVPAMDHWDEAVARDPYPGDWDGCDVDAACLVFTSGSTGAPRGVTLTHDNIRFVVGAIQERLGYRPDDTVGGFLPLAFDYGLYQIFLAARSGAKLYLGDPDQVGPRLPGILKSAGITVLPGVPSIYAALITLARRRPFELPRLRAITNTGERAGDDVVQLYARDLIASVTRPVAQLVGYARVSVEPGESRTLTFRVPPTRLSFTGRDGRRVVEPGEVELWVGDSVADRALLHTVTLTGEVHTVGLHDPRRTTVDLNG